jgi:toxin FitB
VSYLVDANVLSEATRPRAETRVVEWLDQHDRELHVSVITLGEILKGIRLLASGPKQQRLTRWLTELEASFEERILPVDQVVMREWAALYARNQKAGRLYSSFDSLVAATAIRHELTVVTRNESDFPPEIPLLNPWTQAE